MMVQKRTVWRTAFYALVPSWLYNGEGELLLHAIARVVDAWLERLRQGTYARFPSFAPESALRMIGASRLIPRGRSELTANYRARLLAWRNPGHRIRGSALALLLQVYHYWGGASVWTITPKGNRHRVDSTGAFTFEYGIPWEWDDLSTATHWARFWLVLDAESMLGGTVTAHPTFGSGNVWGGRMGPKGRGYTVGQTTVQRADASAMRGLVTGSHAWRPLHARPEWVIVRLAGAPWPEPDGTWNTRRGRFAAAQAGMRFWPLRASV